MHLILADDRDTYRHGQMAGQPVGGAEASFLNLALALYRAGHRVTALTPRPGSWHELPRLALADYQPQPCAVFIASRSARLLPLGREAAQRVLWLHNPARYLRKPRNLWWLARYRPLLLTSSAYHRHTVPALLRGLPAISSPLGLDSAFLEPRPRSSPPSPIAVFTSQPQRGLEWLVALWRQRIHPVLPAAQLWVYTGYQQDAANRAVLARLKADAEALAATGIRLCEPLAPPAMAAMLREQARVMLYPGDAGETFCLAAAEAQASGVPLVTRPLGCLPERLQPERSGFVCDAEADFAEAARRLLCDDTLWAAQHRASLQGESLSWAQVAERLLNLLHTPGK